MEVPNVTQMEDVLILPVGTICNLIDQIDYEISTNCTIKYVEEDPEFPGLVYYYLIANNEALNNKTDPRFPWPFFEIVDNMCGRLIPIGAPAM